MGLMWYQPSPRNNSLPLNSRLRHEPNHDDQLERFGWNEHDGGFYGLQEIVDPQNQISLTTQLVYIPRHDNETGRWTLRVRGVKHRPEHHHDDDNKSTNLSLLWYLTTPENLTATYNPSSGIIYGEHFHTCINHAANNTYSSYIDSRTNTSKVYNATYFAVFQVPPSQHFNPKPIVLQELRNPTSTLPPHLFDPSALYRAATVTKGNQIVQQVFLETPFAVDFHFELHTRHGLFGNGAMLASDTTCSAASWGNVTEALNRARINFQNRFQKTFLTMERSRVHDRRESGVTTLQVATEQWTDDELRTAQYALGNMLSSISYMHGRSLIYDFENETITTGPQTTGLAIVPDRPDHAQGKRSLLSSMSRR